MTLTRSLSTLFLALSLGACVHAGSDGGQAAPLRIIVVPAAGMGLEPATQAGGATLSRSAGVPLLYLRALGGNAHLLATRDAVDRAAAAEILERLAADPAIAMVEEDRRVTHQTPGETR